MDHLPFFFPSSLSLFFSFLFASRFFVSQAGDKRKISTHRVIIATSRTIGNSRRIPIQIRKEKKKRSGWWWWWEGREEKRRENGTRKQTDPPSTVHVRVCVNRLDWLTEAANCGGGCQTLRGAVPVSRFETVHIVYFLRLNHLRRWREKMSLKNLNKFMLFGFETSHFALLSSP